MHDLELRRRLVVGHRGAPGQLPEHSAPGYRAAIDAGADVIEVDVVACADGTLVARHELGLALTTDVSARADLADRCSARRVAHEDVVDWWADELTTQEVTSLRCRERWPQVRPASAAHDDEHPVLTLAHVLRLAKDSAEERGRPVGVAIELKDVAVSDVHGRDVVAAVLADLATAGLPTASTPVWVMAFEADPLERLHGLRATGQAPDVCLVQLLEDEPPREESAWDAIAGRADVVGLSLDLVLSSAGAVTGRQVLAAARSRHLDVWTWTLRAENAFLPSTLWRGEHAGSHGDLAAQVSEAVAAGVRGLVTDQPDAVRRASS
jgi:glycerophosphoryl diester phosphodiesterase